MPALLLAGNPCQGKTKQNTPCTRTTKEGIFCFQHNPESNKCNGLTKSGKPCSRITKQGKCKLHQ